MQAKRIQVAETNDGAGGQTSVELSVPSEPREEVNFHNIWGSVTVEPETAAANAQGTWVLYRQLDPAAPQVTFTDAFLNLETLNVDIIACGVWSASNETPYNTSFQIKTSRNIPSGGRLILSNTVTGITADLASNRVMLCAHTTRK